MHKLPQIAHGRSVFLALCIATIGLGACSQVDEGSREKQTQPRPLMKFEDETVLESFQDSILEWRLRTEYLERWAGSERIFVKPIDVDIFDSTGAKVAFLRADSGSLDTKMTFINAYGHVHAHSPDGASVRADSLTWSRSSNRVQTQSPVRVVSPEGDVLSGTGFISDSRLNNWQILRNVRGIFQDAAKRLKEKPPRASQSQANGTNKVQSPNQPKAQKKKKAHSRFRPKFNSKLKAYSSTEKARDP